ncbi:MAG: 16S rRNA (guanine(966)-N(2))-methyltransferase RsmD, partial [Candidatus Omnitrophota bacterium]
PGSAEGSGPPQTRELRRGGRGPEEVNNIMKIISGKFRGRVIDMPKDARPTSNKAREALFEILKNDIHGKSFLDLYSGSGAVGLEALSRGAEGISFVDSSQESIKTIRKNITKLNILDSYSIYIYTKNALQAIRDFNKKGARFDIIFMDPPYYKDIAKNTLIEISNYDILTANALIVIELYKKDDLPEKVNFLERFRVSRYGDTKLEFYKICKR